MSAYDITLSDSVATATMPLTNVPLTTEFLEGAVDVTTLSFNLYTDFITQKRIWEHTWAFMTDADYDTLKAFYDRQFTTFLYPELTIANEGVTGVTVRMYLENKKIIDRCGTVEDVTVRFRETRQQGS